MLTVKHLVAESPIHGLGVYTSERIEAGQIVWMYDETVDLSYTELEVDQMDKSAAAIIKTHAEYFPDKKIFILGTDGDYYMNHSFSPNLSDFGEIMRANRDILPMEELTCDYSIVHVLGFDPLVEERSLGAA